jgi:diadenylate cyclase
MVQSLLDYLHRVANNNSPAVILIELVLIGLVVYWVVDFLEGTRGERLFRGVFFILLVGVLVLNPVVQRSHFDRLQYHYKGFLIVVLIATVAAFQPEIRRGLIRIGQPHVWARASEQWSRTIEEIVMAARDLSATRTGAIMVLEREVALGEFIETGVRLDAKVTSELLRTIFYPGTCLHDMAVILRGDRLVAARVQLPLAEPEAVKAVLRTNPKMHEGRELGSRHMAAIGITAGSDAVCVVVSEETGTLSVAYDGRLDRHLTEADLRSKLMELVTAVGFPKRSGWGRRNKSPA